jgi:hypothetical protein
MRLPAGVVEHVLDQLAGLVSPATSSPTAATARTRPPLRAASRLGRFVGRRRRVRRRDAPPAVAWMVEHSAPELFTSNVVMRVFIVV